MRTPRGLFTGTRMFDPAYTFLAEPPSISISSAVMKRASHVVQIDDVRSDDRALRPQRVAQAPAVQVAGTTALARAEGRGCSRSLAHGVDGRDDARARGGFVGRGQAAAGDEQVVDTHGDQTAVRNLVVAGCLETDELAAGAGRIVDVDRVGAAGDGIVEACSAEHVLAGQRVETLDSTRLTNADLRGDLEQPRLLQPGAALAHEGQDFH